MGRYNGYVLKGMDFLVIVFHCLIMLMTCTYIKDSAIIVQFVALLIIKLVINKPNKPNTNNLQQL